MQQQQPYQQQQQQPGPVTYIIVQQPAQTPQYAPPGGQFVGNFSAAGSRVCGGLTIIMGLLCIGGALTETIYTAIKLEGDVFTSNEYAGYWCGTLIIVAGATAAEAGRHPTDARIISNLVGAVIGIAFASTLIGLTADVFDVGFQNAVLLAAWGTMVGAASATLLLTLIISILCLMAMICRKKVAPNVAQIEIPAQQQQQQQQQQQVFYNQYQPNMHQQQQQYPSADAVVHKF